MDRNSIRYRSWVKSLGSIFTSRIVLACTIDAVNLEELYIMILLCFSKALSIREIALQHRSLVNGLVLQMDSEGSHV